MSESFEQWAILELMGHVRLAGKVTEEEHFGAKLGRIDIPTGDAFTTQYFSGGSIYRLTPTTEEIARGVALRNQPEPVYRWELPAPASRTAPEHMEGDSQEDERYSQFGYGGELDDE
jgi:hypothetical protein